MLNSKGLLVKIMILLVGTSVVYPGKPSYKSTVEKLLCQFDEDFFYKNLSSCSVRPIRRGITLINFKATLQIDVGNFWVFDFIISSQFQNYYPLILDPIYSE
jgi:hypothetical protein